MVQAVVIMITMNKVAKLVIIDSSGKYLLLYRDAHRVFGNDPDLPGGTMEPGEQLIDTMIREVYEETSIEININKVRSIYQGFDYSHYGMEYALYILELSIHPNIVLSAEHASYDWVSRDVFLKKAKSAKDNYMHMVYRELT